jgi:nitrogen regulatory protein P-II 1
MLFLVVFILDDPTWCSGILDAWESVGVTGITILESSGLGRIRKAALREDLPLMSTFSEVLKHQETSHRTLFSVVKGQDLVDRIVEVTEEAVGDLDEEDNGFLFVLPVSQVHGLRSRE